MKKTSTKKSVAKTAKAKTNKVDREKEVQLMLAKAEQVKGEQLIVDDAGELQRELEARKFQLTGIDDPSLKYKIYYKQIDKLLRSRLPKGKKYKLERDKIYEEKCAFLTRGHRKNKLGIRGADSRQGYIEDAQELLNLIIEWVVAQGTLLDLYLSLSRANQKKGYPVATLQ